VGYVKKAQELLDRHATGFAAVAPTQQMTNLRQGLTKYKDYIDQYAELTMPAGRRAHDHEPVQKIRLEASIRKTGKDIITIAEEISKTERARVAALLAGSQRTFILSVALLSLVVIAIGQVLSRVVVRPLKLIEKNMQVIADGRFEQIRINSRDREIASLTNAFNKMLRELELRQRHLVQSEKLASLGTLLSGVAHELNNPLSNISSSGQILMEELDDCSPEFRKELVGQINEQTDRARNIVRSLLEFSRDKEFKKQPLLLRELLDETIRFMKGQTRSNIAIRIDVPDGLTIMADKQRIQQVFLNLIKNGIEAIEATGELDISGYRNSAHDKAGEDEDRIYNYLKYHGKCTLEQDTIDIRIHDSGPGIDSEVLPRIFDPFFTTKDVGKGSGLGLFIVHELIEEHDGCIGVDSTPGKGTTFLIRLPLQ
jgi:signal transduction histidine kinase